MSLLFKLVSHSKKTQWYIPGYWTFLFRRLGDSNGWVLKFSHHTTYMTGSENETHMHVAWEERRKIKLKMRTELCLGTTWVGFGPGTV